MVFTISFRICHNIYNHLIDSSIEVNEDLTEESIKKTVFELISCYREDPDSDYSLYFDKYFFRFENYYINSIVENLYKNKYFVINRYNNNYVIAFAINYTRFEIYSKDYDKVLIKWRENDEDDEIKGIIDDPEYNANAVIKTIENL